MISLMARTLLAVLTWGQGPVHPWLARGTCEPRIQMSMYRGPWVLKLETVCWQVGSQTPVPLQTLQLLSVLSCLR